MKAPRQKRGKPILASTLNAVIDGHNESQEPAPISQKDSIAKVSRAKRFTITAIDGDFLVCTPAGVGSTASVNVARPPLLQRSVTAHNGVAYTYSDDQTRSADATESQVVVPAYVVGDDIYAFRVIGGTGVTNDDSETVEWVDANLDGRAWAKSA